jgi:hypothetical protein
MNGRTVTTRALLCLAVVFATALPPFAQTTPDDPHVGTWKLNLGKSSPGPKSGSATVEAVGQGVRINAEITDAQGNPTRLNFGVVFVDGKSYPVTGTPTFDAVSYKRINDSTIEQTRTKAGKVVQTVIEVISADGRTMTFTTTGINANGQQFSNVAVFDKE